MNFSDMNETKGYIVFAKEGGFYTLVGPGGRILNSRSTMRGVRRAIRRDRKNAARRPFWERPVVYSEPGPESGPRSEETPSSSTAIPPTTHIAWGICPCGSIHTNTEARWANEGKDAYGDPILDHEGMNEMPGH